MRTVAFDFATRKEWTIDPSEFSQQFDPGVFYWVIARHDESALIREALIRFNVPLELSSLLEHPGQGMQLDLFEEAAHFSLNEIRITDQEMNELPLSFLLGEGFLITVVPESSPVMERILRIYSDDFRRFARSPGFLLYEFGTQFLEAYRRVFQHYTDRAESIQLRLFNKVTDEIFAEVSALTGEILAFRRSVLAARDIFNDISSRKSAFVAETTQPALAILSDRMGRLCDDIAGIRSVLNETLNLYMGMVSHRTNRIINRLTVFSMIFLPLSFLAGVYGMNFVAFPELRWRYAYPAFWLFVFFFVIAFVAFVKKKRWI